MHGPYADPEENLVHEAVQVPLFRGANYCASCHFDKVKDVTQKDLPGEILQGTICQDCHMEQSTGSSTSKRGAMTRSIGRHYFRGVVIPGILLKNRNLQAEWMPRIDIESSKSADKVEGTALVKVGSLPHSFPDGDPVLKQFDLAITVKDAQGKVLAQETQAIRPALREDSSRADSRSVHQRREHEEGAVLVRGPGRRDSRLRGGGVELQP